MLLTAAPDSTRSHSHSSASIEERLQAQAAGNGDEYTASVRPIAIGDALLRLAEKALAKKLKNAFIAHLMPHQVGVGVPGGLNMWATVVETMLQRDGDDEFAGNAPVYISPNDAGAGEDWSYRERKVREMIDAHDRRLRAVVDLSRRDGRSYTSLVKLSVQLSHLLLSWSCNARDVHLLRGLPGGSM